MITIMSEGNAEELIRSMSAQRVEAMRAAFEADLMAARYRKKSFAWYRDVIATNGASLRR
ncbi:6-phospho-beta-glucosidase [Centipeda periodontii DSM 2778]|uniref:6-phospho-beta-glucosidase n=2 Tax=Centipeda TaxID=82202 RepID=F5RKB9_9FIRM|nr:6-phospho-beta-glucosidase [Centipeda periodontii DSM 2778]